MANPQPTDAHLRISHAISEELMMRDFSKRQRNILDFILRLSWGCGKKQAVIPKLQDFEICGVSKTKIKEELNYLINANVIHWTMETNEFSFKKDYDAWKISIVPGYNKNRLTELIHINLNTVPETGIKLPKRQQSSRKSNKVPEKWELEGELNPHKQIGKDASKESNYKKNIYSEIVMYLNQKCNKSFRATSQKTRDLVAARLNDKFTIEDFKIVIDNKAATWNREPKSGEKDMRPYLRPETLFGAKFESYLNEKQGKQLKKNGPKQPDFTDDELAFIERMKG